MLLVPERDSDSQLEPLISCQQPHELERQRGVKQVLWGQEMAWEREREDAFAWHSGNAQDGGIKENWLQMSAVE